jgi:hypothetical protein
MRCFEYDRPLPRILSPRNGLDLIECRAAIGLNNLHVAYHFETVESCDHSRDEKRRALRLRPHLAEFREAPFV